MVATLRFSTKLHVKIDKILLKITNKKYANSYQCESYLFIKNSILVREFKF